MQRRATEVFVTGGCPEGSSAKIHVRPIDGRSEWSEPLLEQCDRLGVPAELQEEGRLAVLLIAGNPEITKAAMVVARDERIFAKECDMGASTREAHRALMDLNRSLEELRGLVVQRLPGVRFAKT